MLNGIPATSKPFTVAAKLRGPGDWLLANLEVPLTSAKVPTLNKSEKEVKERNQFILKANPAHIRNLEALGVSAVSLANNHAMDYRGAGLLETISLLDKAGIGHAGAGRNATAASASASLPGSELPPTTLLSCLAFVGTKALRKTTPATVTSPGVFVLNFSGRIDDAARAKLGRWISSARRPGGTVIVAVHWGIERKTVPTPYQVSLGRAMVDSGADLVWGHHPHVLQGAEVYKGVPILYSMGNLVSALPAETGLVRMKFQNGRWRFRGFVPLGNSGGVIKAVPLTQQRARRLKFRELCKQVQTKFPSPDSRPLL